MKIVVQQIPEAADINTVPLKGMELVAKTIDPEIRKFEEWFQDPKRGNGPLAPLEREILRSYLYQKLMGVL